MSSGWPAVENGSCVFGLAKATVDVVICMACGTYSSGMHVFEITRGVVIVSEIESSTDDSC